MRARRTFVGTMVLAAILITSCLIVPAEAGDQRAPEGLSERVLRELSARFALPEHVMRELRTILRNEERVLRELAGIHVKLDGLLTAVADVQAACLPPDLLPVPPLGGVPIPTNFCDIVDDNLIVRVKNQGRTDAGPSTLRVTFSTPGGPVVSDVATPALAGNGGFVDLQVPVPPACFDPHDPFPSPCNFQIAADVLDEVSVENSETNNFAAGACVPVL
jgi:hypothetical protein